MLIQISENRWMSEPEAVYRSENRDRRCNVYATADPCRKAFWDHDEKDMHEWKGGYEWAARMPSGELEWLSDKEYEKLVAPSRRQAELMKALDESTEPLLSDGYMTPHGPH